MPFEGFEYNVDGRKVNQEEWLHSLKAKAVSTGMPEVARKIKTDVAHLRCSVHHESPTVVETTIIGNELRTKISACCDEA